MKKDAMGHHATMSVWKTETQLLITFLLGQVKNNVI